MSESNPAVPPPLVASRLRDVPDFPEPGVVFKDVTPLLADGPAFGAVVRDIADRRRGTVTSSRASRPGASSSVRRWPTSRHRVHPGPQGGQAPRQDRGRLVRPRVRQCRGSRSTRTFVGDERVLVIDDVPRHWGTAAATCDSRGLGGQGRRLEAVVGSRSSTVAPAWTGATRTRRSSSAGLESAGDPGQGIT